MYYEYWGLNRPPFDNVPDPTMYFRAHQTVEQAVGEVLFAIEEGDECLAVVVGEVGLGKTTALRVILDTLEPEKYRIAFITNPDVTFTMLLREIVGQLKGEPCTIRRKDELLEEYNHILFETADEGKRVLVFIDEGNAFKAVNLESLRLLTNMQEDDRNLFTIVLAGQPKLAKMLEAPSRANLFQRIGVYCHLEKMESWEVVRDYIDHRMERAGRVEPVFTDEGIKALFKYSEGGVPRLVNKVAKLALKAGETAGAAVVGPDVIASIGSRFERFTRKSKPAVEEQEEPVEEREEAAGVVEETAVETAAEPVAQPVEAEAAEEPQGQMEWGPMEQEAEEHAAEPEQEGSGGYYYEESSAPAATRIEVASGNNGDTVVQACLDAALRPEVMERARTADQREREKMAGQLAAEELKKHPEFIAETNDPVVAWQELRREILSAFAEG